MKKIFCFLSIFLLSMSLVSCQKNPEELLINKNSTLDINQLPEIWVESIPLNHLLCEINADVKYAPGFSPKSYIARPKKFSDTDIRNILSIFAPNAIGQRDTLDTKEDIMNEIMQVKLGEPYYDQDGKTQYRAYEGQMEMLDFLEKLFESAPDREEFSDVDEKVKVPSIFTYLLEDNRKLNIALDVDTIVINFDHNDIIQSEKLVMTGDAIWGEPKGSKLEVSSISEEDALKYSKKILQMIDAPYFDVASIEKARIVDRYTSEIKTHGYMIGFARNDGNFKPVDLYHTISLINNEAEVFDYSSPRFTEYLFMMIDDTGLRRFEWLDPLEIVSSKEVKLISFEQVQEIMRRYIRFCFSWTSAVDGEELEPQEFYELALSSTLVGIKDDPKNEEIVPTWILYSNYQSRQNVGGRPYILCINAIDGSLINPYPKSG